MSRPCTICNHPQRPAIDRALASGDPYRQVALRYGISTATVSRHRTAHLADRLARAKERAASDQRADDQRLLAERAPQQAAEAAFDLDVLNELQRCVQRLIRLMDACEQYLRDPEDPERYDLTPRAESVLVTYSEPGQGGLRVRKRAPLSQLLDRASGVAPTTRVELDAADPRRLLIQAAGRIQAQLQLLVRISQPEESEREINVFTHPQWLALRATIMESLAAHPDARASLLARLTTIER